jgi:AmmeMemoRadiSam system protein B
MTSRSPAVAGLFYPDDPTRLRNDLSTMLRQAKLSTVEPATIRALIVPHAGYDYSGSTAAVAYRLLASRSNQIRRVVLLGPSHRVGFHGLAVPTFTHFTTPLGEIGLDLPALAAIRDLPGVQVRDDAHDQEHSLEVQLPFLQCVLKDFLLVPIVVGRADAATVADVIEALWEEDDTLVVISSDLSHFLPYEDAVRTDGETTRRIEQLNSELVGTQACGCHPLNGLLRLARQQGLRAETLHLCNSGDTAGPRDRVVGYGSYAVSGQCVKSMP